MAWRLARVPKMSEEVPEGLQPGQTMRVKLKDEDEDFEMLVDS